MADFIDVKLVEEKEETNFNTIDINLIPAEEQGKTRETNPIIQIQPEPEKTENVIPTNTLNEPVAETLKRDLIRILIKLKFVLNPYIKDDERSKQLQNWDLWGPLVFNILLATTLAMNNSDKGTLFVLVFTIFWLGSIIITLNSKLLGSKLTLFQAFCLLGYCMFPLNVTALIFVLSSFYEVIKVVVVLFSCAWASYSSVGFLKKMISEEKKFLMLYPVILFYFFLSWFILMNH